MSNRAVGKKATSRRKAAAMAAWTQGTVRLAKASGRGEQGFSVMVEVPSYTLRCRKLVAEEEEAAHFATSTDSVRAFREFLFQGEGSARCASGAANRLVSRTRSFVCVRQNRWTGLRYAVVLAKLSSGQLRSISFQEKRSTRTLKDASRNDKELCSRAVAFARSVVFKSWREQQVDSFIPLLNSEHASSERALKHPCAVVGIDKGDKVDCSCGKNRSRGQMVTCEACGTREHLDCLDYKQMPADHICSACLRAQKEEVAVISIGEQEECRSLSAGTPPWIDTRPRGDESVCCQCGCEDNEDFETMIQPPCSCDGEPVLAHPSCLKSAMAAKDPNKASASCMACGKQAEDSPPRLVAKRTMPGRGVKRLRSALAQHTGGKAKPENDMFAEPEVKKPEASTGVARFGDAASAVPIKKRRIPVPSPSPSPDRSRSSSPLRSSGVGTGYQDQAKECLPKCTENKVQGEDDDYHAKADDSMSGESSGDNNQRDRSHWDLNMSMESWNHAEEINLRKEDGVATESDLNNEDAAPVEDGAAEVAAALPDLLQQEKVPEIPNEAAQNLKAVSENLSDVSLNRNDVAQNRNDVAENLKEDNVDVNTEDQDHTEKSKEGNNVEGEETKVEAKEVVIELPENAANFKVDYDVFEDEEEGEGAGASAAESEAAGAGAGADAAEAGAAEAAEAGADAALGATAATIHLPKSSVEEAEKVEEGQINDWGEDAGEDVDYGDSDEDVVSTGVAAQGEGDGAEQGEIHDTSLDEPKRGGGGSGQETQSSSYNEADGRSRRGKTSGWDQLPEGFETAEDALRASQELQRRTGRPLGWAAGAAGRGGGTGLRPPPRYEPDYHHQRLGPSSWNRNDMYEPDSRFFNRDFERGRSGMASSGRRDGMWMNHPPPAVQAGWTAPPAKQHHHHHHHHQQQQQQHQQHHHMSPPPPSRFSDVGYGPTNAAAVAAAKVESSGFVVAPDGTITRAAGSSPPPRGGRHSSFSAAPLPPAAGGRSSSSSMFNHHQHHQHHQHHHNHHAAAARSEPPPPPPPMMPPPASAGSMRAPLAAPTTAMLPPPPPPPPPARLRSGWDRREADPAAPFGYRRPPSRSPSPPPPLRARYAAAAPPPPYSPKLPLRSPPPPMRRLSSSSSSSSERRYQQQQQLSSYEGGGGGRCRTSGWDLGPNDVVPQPNAARMFGGEDVVVKGGGTSDHHRSRSFRGSSSSSSIREIEADDVAPRRRRS